MNEESSPSSSKLWSARLDFSTPRHRDMQKEPFEFVGVPEIYFRYPGMSYPPMAGGEFGIAPVFATSVSYENGEWIVGDRTFDSAGSMHAANEMIWLHYDEVNGFPNANV